VDYVCLLKTSGPEARRQISSLKGTFLTLPSSPACASPSAIQESTLLKEWKPSAGC